MEIRTVKIGIASILPKGVVLPNLSSNWKPFAVTTVEEIIPNEKGEKEGWALPVIWLYKEESVIREAYIC